MPVILVAEDNPDIRDLLSMLLSAQDDDGSGMTDKQLRDECMTLFTAGHETTANALTFTLWLLDRHHDVAARLRAEVRDVLGPDRLPEAARKIGGVVRQIREMSSGFQSEVKKARGQ